MSTSCCWFNACSTLRIARNARNRFKDQSDAFDEVGYYFQCVGEQNLEVSKMLRRTFAVFLCSTPCTCRLCWKHFGMGRVRLEPKPQVSKPTLHDYDALVAFPYLTLCGLCVPPQLRRVVLVSSVSPLRPWLKLSLCVSACSCVCVRVQVSDARPPCLQPMHAGCGVQRLLQRDWLKEGDKMRCRTSCPLYLLQPTFEGKSPGSEFTTQKLGCSTCLRF